jgi:hypothetical protein
MILDENIIKFVFGLKDEIEDMKDRMDLIETENAALRAELVDMAKDPKIKGFYYCDPPEASSFAGIFTLKDEAVKGTPDIEVWDYKPPPCFNCDSDCSHCGEDDCVLQRVDGICRKCSSANKCFS